MVIACAGDFSERKILKAIETAFGKIPQGRAERHDAAQRPFRKTAPPVILKRPVQQG